MDRAIRKNFIKLSSIVTVLLLMTGIVFSGIDEECFLRGNQYYDSGDYDNALYTYTMMNHKGRAVLYNIGNCYYRKRDYAHALVYWNRAQIGATPGEWAIIERNKEYVFKEVRDNSYESLKKIVAKYSRAIIPCCSLLFLQLLFLISCFLFIFLLSHERRCYRKWALIFLMVLIVIIGGLLAIHYVNNSVVRAIIVKKEAMLFSGPHSAFQVLSPIAYAREVVVKETREGWHKIRYADNIGWVEAEVVEVI